MFDSFEKEEEDILAVLMLARIDTKKVAEREVESGYVYSPLLRNSFVDITALVLKSLSISGNVGK